jgi:LytS/YehU family sensor histidine kinase
MMTKSQKFSHSASTVLLEQGTQTPSPAPDPIPAESKNQQESGTHVGLRNVEKRLQTAYEGRATLTLTQRDGGGTEATVLINQDNEDSNASFACR